MKRIKFRIDLLIIFMVSLAVSCDTRNVPTHDTKSCEFSDIELDSLIFYRNKTDDSLLFEHVRNCPDLPHIVELKLDLFTSLKHFREGLSYLNTLDRGNFGNSYDSLIYRTFFESKLTANKEEKIKMYKTVTVELEKYLRTNPLDTLALGNYCLYSLECRPSEFVFEKIDSMASANNNDPTYEFVIFQYFPTQLRQYQMSVLKKRQINEHD